MKILFWLILFSTCYASYDPAYYEYSSKREKPDGVAVIAYNRPHYFKQLLDSLEKNPESQTLPFFFFLDGGDPLAQAENISLINASNLAFKEIIPREINYGCPKNHIDSKRFLFDWCGFKRVVVMEEDLIVSQDYFNLLFRLYDWAVQNYSNIGTVQLWSICELQKSQKKKILSRVQETSDAWSMVTYCMGKDVWNAIVPMMSQYEQFIDPLLGDPQYDIVRSKPTNGPTGPDCGNWLRNFIATYNRKAVLNTFPKNKPLWQSNWRIGVWTDKISISQDKMTSLIIWLAGYTRIQTTVNRAAHIGAFGISGAWHRDVVLDEFPEDKTTLQFRE